MFIYQFRLRSTAITFIFQNLVKETPKKLIWKMTSCVYSTSGAISQTNIKALVWNLVCLFYIRSYNTYIPVFWKFWKKDGFSKVFLKKIDFWIFGGQKLKILKIRDSHLVENLICIQLALTVCRLLYCLILYDFLNSCHFFIQNGITWRHQNSIFSKSFEPILSKFSVKTSNWCPKRYPKFYVHNSYRFGVIENIREGGRFSPPPANGGLSSTCPHSRIWSNPFTDVSWH